MKYWLACLTTLIVLLAAGGVNGAIITVDPDAFPSGTVITNAFPGVTLTTRDSLPPGTNARDVLAIADSAASTGSNVFAQDSGDPTWGNGIWEFLRADFSSGATQVWLDFAANDGGGDRNAQLLAYDASDTLVDIDTVDFVPAGSFATLTVSAPNIAYIAAFWDETNRIENGALDNLRYENIPEPATLSLMVLGGLGFLARRRKTR